MSSICDGPLTSLAFCWTVERSDGAGIALTSSDRAVSKSNVRYDPESGMTPAAITRSLGLDPHSAEVSGALSAAAITEADLALGRWNGARIALTALDWSAPDQQSIQLLGGVLGEVSIAGESFTAELLGAAAKLSAPVCPLTSAECRAEFGDKRCRVDLAGRTVRARVLSTADNVIETDQPLDDRFLFGRLRYLRGANCGLQTIVLAANGTTATVRDLPPAPVEAGTLVEIREGCDKTLATCASRFANAVNFRGEPHLPGNDLLTRYPGA